MVKRIVVTGAGGFIATNLLLRLRERGYADVGLIDRQTRPATRAAMLRNADFVFHLAGVNRPNDPNEFEAGNLAFTRSVCAELEAGSRARVVFSSSTQAALENPYGRSKAAAEKALQQYHEATGASVYILRLPNVFGKWTKPNYNSAVATFCYNTVNGLPIVVHDASAVLNLVYIDDVIATMMRLLESEAETPGFVPVSPVYETTVGEVAGIIANFRRGRAELFMPDAANGLTRALYATYLSYLPPADFVYGLTMHRDARGVFAEVLKTTRSGQLSFFTAGPGVTRGEHYHHSKSEKFIVVHGTARFRFRQVVSNITHEVVVSAADASVVETVPGWAHSVTNVGFDELVVMLWANEVFDPEASDTYPCRTEPVEVQAITAD